MRLFRMYRSLHNLVLQIALRALRAAEQSTAVRKFEESSGDVDRIEMDDTGKVQ
ncbi:hypothetical protein [Paraburkholderia caledonica]|uniref:hypothetical protein n=1 Tax=Paraburkholderia caledonica TaxID=134536 RepID=UPI001374E0E9|nr:hypothetical protein [Paraburkholderia caledonica]